MRTFWTAVSTDSRPNGTPTATQQPAVRVERTEGTVFYLPVPEAEPRYGVERSPFAPPCLPQH